MEKLIYVVWKPADLSLADFREEILGRTAVALVEHGARQLAVNLADELAVPGLRITRLEPTGTVAFWLPTALGRAPIEEALARVSSRLAGYVALESVPLAPPHAVAPYPEPAAPSVPLARPHAVAPCPQPAGALAFARIEGLYTVAFLEKPDTLTYEAWLDRWQGSHTAIAIETQSTFLYVQNVLVRALTPGAPPWTAIVEEAFPAAAATDPMVFYAADSPAKLAEHQRRMMASVERFIDFARFETLPMSAYVTSRERAA